MSPVDTGLLVLRVILALLLIGHGSQKLFGLFRGRGIAGTAEIFESQGLKPGRLMVVAAGITELAGAALLALGLANPLAVAMVLGAMIVAISTLWPKGLWGHLGGYEVPFCYAVMAFVLGITGPGSYSIDALTPWAGLFGPLWALGGLVLAFALSTPLLLMVAKGRRSA